MVAGLVGKCLTKCQTSRSEANLAFVSHIAGCGYYTLAKSVLAFSPQLGSMQLPPCSCPFQPLISAKRSQTTKHTLTWLPTSLIFGNGASLVLAHRQHSTTQDSRPLKITICTEPPNTDQAKADQ